MIESLLAFVDHTLQQDPEIQADQEFRFQIAERQRTRRREAAGPRLHRTHPADVFTEGEIVVHPERRFGEVHRFVDDRAHAARAFGGRKDEGSVVEIIQPFHGPEQVHRRIQCDIAIEVDVRGGRSSIRSRDEKCVKPAE